MASTRCSRPYGPLTPRCTGGIGFCKDVLRFSTFGLEASILGVQEITGHLLFLLRAGEREEEVGRRVEVAIEGCFAIEGCLPQDVLKWPKKLPAEAGTSGHFFRTKSSLYCKPELDGGRQSLDRRYWRRMVGGKIEFS